MLSRKRIICHFVGLLSLIAIANGAVTDIMNRCCDIGRQWYMTNHENCSPYTSPIHGIQAKDKEACGALLEVCCLVHRQERQCTLGKQSAKLGRGCASLQSRPGSEDARECCNCCELGAIAHEQGLSCTLFQRYGVQCDTAFQECCMLGRRPASGTHHHHRQHPETTTTSQPDGADFDICSKFPGQLCQQVCINTPGSYDCACHDGFSLQADKKTCRQDASGSRCDTFNPCQHKCVDAGITTHCQCFDGFVLDTDEKSCRDLNECTLNSHTCTYQQRCINTPGSYICEGPTQDRCLQGFNWNRLTRQCEDIDECSSTTSSSCHPSEFCINTAGSFRCVSIGVESDREISDSDSHFNLFPTLPPPSLPPVAAITTVSSICGAGYSYSSHTNQCEDLDECEWVKCPEVNEMCRNTVGSYTCVQMCGKGFKYELRHACEDINECALNQDTCTVGQTCENSIGSFHCRRNLSCGTGYTLDQESQDCLDDDECRLGTHNCGVARECTNIPGSFRCVPKVCPLGYKLDYENGDCHPVECARGMKPDAAGNCIDINECVERPEVCRPNQECQNHVGSFTCFNKISCSAGYQLNEAGTRCDDIDECRTGKHDCIGSLMECINRPGSYMCQCPQGYQINHALKTCEDLDECRFNGQSCAQNARCENTHGSYRCLCKEGFLEELDGKALTCKDVDECARPGMCQQNCRNTWGSFQCTCSEGYQIAADGRTCDDADECLQAEQKGLLLCMGVCENTHGSFACSCPAGYRMSADDRTCEDVDECTNRIANCNSPDELCINTRGGYKCETVLCPKGFVKAPILGNRNSNVKCQRKTFLCPQGDVECLYAPLSYSVNFITFPSKIRIPADLFTMRGPLSPYRRLVFDLKVIKAQDPVTRETRVDRSFFNIHQVRDNEAVVQLLKEVEGPQDIELQLDMNIYSKEFRHNNDEVFFGTAVARILVYVTKDDW